MKLICASAAAAILLSGCASYAPTRMAIAGHYYIVGDKDCTLQAPVAPTRIACGNRKRELTGYRDAMTEAEMAQYNAAVLSRIQQDIEMQQLAAQMESTSQTWFNAGQQFLQQSQQFSTQLAQPSALPQVQPIVPFRASGGTRYTQVGGTLFGSDGSNYRQIGNTLFGSDGTTSRRIGNTVFGSDGTNYRQIGGTVFGSDGSSHRQIGNTIFSSDGGRCVTIGPSTFCNK